jgi:hypothetical protein
MTGILWAVVISPPSLQSRYEAGAPHHVTLQCGVEREDWNHLIGLPMTAGIEAECWNSRIQALKLILPTWVQCQNPHPHLAISWVIDADPLEANAMLAGEHESQAVSFDAIHTIIEFQEWGEIPNKPRRWADNPVVLCPTCLRQGVETQVRSVTGYCRKHRNAKK